MRKAIFFTATSILIVAFILSAFAQPAYTSQKYGVASAETRVGIANDYVSDLRDVYLPKIITVSGYRALYALTEYVKANALFSDEGEFSSLFREALLEGTINGVPQDIMRGYSLFEKMDELELKSESALNIRTSFTRNYFAGLLISDPDNQMNEKLKIYHSSLTGPWRVGINLSINYTADAVSAYWNRSDVINAFVSFEGLDDPLIASADSYDNSIRKQNDSALNITGFFYHINSMTYSFNKNAPSYLQRFYNDFSGSECCGMETMINPKTLGVAAQEKSYADWCFYSGSCSESLYYVSCITSEFAGFRIGPSHGAKYNISSYLYSQERPGSCSESPWPPA